MSGEPRYGTPAGEGAFSREEQRVLEAVNRRAMAGRSLDEVMTFFWETTRAVSPADRVTVALLDEDGETLVARWTRSAGAGAGLPEGFEQRLRGSSLEPIVRRGTPRVIDDLAAYAAAHPLSRTAVLLSTSGIRSSMTCPLKIDDRVVGVLFRSSRDEAAYDARQVRLHGAMAGALSQAVEKVWQLDRLTAANRSYTELLGFVSHEIKSPVASLATAADVLLNGYLGELTDRQKEKVARMAGQARYVLDLVRDYLDFARLEGEGTLTPDIQPLDLAADVVRPALDLAGETLSGKGMALETSFPDADCRVNGEAGLLRIVVFNLLHNAAKYGRESGTVTIGVTEDGGRALCRVRNTGAGFRAEDADGLFRRFSRLPTPEFKTVRGTGLGLYSARRIARAHGGDLTAESDYGSWAEFTLELPAAQADPRPTGG
jgi:signal transduction histidine kinase